MNRIYRTPLHHHNSRFTVLPPLLSKWVFCVRLFATSLRDLMGARDNTSSRGRGGAPKTSKISHQTANKTDGCLTCVRETVPKKICWRNISWNSAGWWLYPRQYSPNYLWPVGYFISFSKSCLGKHSTSPKDTGKDFWKLPLKFLRILCSIYSCNFEEVKEITIVLKGMKCNSLIIH